MVKSSRAAASFLFLLLCAFPLGALTLDAQQVKDPQIREQLARDATLVPMEKGAVFVPWLVDSQREPTFAVYRGEEFITDAETGRRVVLDPGDYVLYIGSGPLDTRIVFYVTVRPERVTVVMPVWGALVVQVVDAYRNPLREGYQISDEETKLYYGAGTGTDETLGEKPLIWILRPGLYRVSKKGEAPDSYRNFVTVRLIEKHASTVLLVFDEKTHQLLGGGEVAGDEQMTQKGNWDLRLLLSGSLSFTNSGYMTEGAVAENALAIGSALNAAALYDDDDWLYSARLDLFEDLMMQDNRKVRNTRDMVKFDTSVIYRIEKWVGPYLSSRLNTRLFFDYRDYSKTGLTYVGVERDGRRWQMRPGDILIAKTGSPTTVQEGLGFNFEYRWGTLFFLTARAGYGLKQDIAPFYYDESHDDPATPEYEIVRIDPFNFSHGPEFSVYFTLMPLSFLEIKEDFISLLPVEHPSQTYFSAETTVSFWISSFATIQYLFWIERQPFISQDIRGYHAVTVQLFYRVF